MPVAHFFGSGDIQGIEEVTKPRKRPESKFSLKKQLNGSDTVFRGIKWRKIRMSVPHPMGETRTIPAKNRNDLTVG